MFVNMSYLSTLLSLNRIRIRAGGLRRCDCSISLGVLHHQYVPNLSVNDKSSVFEVKRVRNLEQFTSFHSCDTPPLSCGMVAHSPTAIWLEIYSVCLFFWDLCVSLGCRLFAFWNNPPRSDSPLPTTSSNRRAINLPFPFPAFIKDSRCHGEEFEGSFIDQRIRGACSDPSVCSLPNKAQAKHSPAEDNSVWDAETLYDSFASVPWDSRSL